MTYSKEMILQQCNAHCKNTLMETLEIQFIDCTENSLTARMPVTAKVHQPDGLLHGGASVTLAESVGSAAAVIFMDVENVSIRGIEITANYVKGVRDGFVYATATILHIGKKTQLWQIRIVNERDKLVSLVKLTTISLPKK
jgi:1,4-dihydroxy-2-naphthoyl-CoA hydrolase